MCTTIRVFLAIGCGGAIAIGTLAPVNAQYYYPPPGYGYRTWNGCPPNWTVQGGVCKPYQGPVGGGWEHMERLPSALHHPGRRVSAVSRKLSARLDHSARLLQPSVLMAARFAGSGVQS